MKFPKSLVAFCIMFTFLSSCTKNDPPAISFYYWKTTFQLTDVEKLSLTEQKVSKMYIRYFDVTMIKGNPFPIRPIIFNERPPNNIEVVPVVYIRNEVMLNPMLAESDLAYNIAAYIDQINSKVGLSIKEIQIDCDWSLKSKDNFLAFVKTLKSITKKALSATIRLHQVKYLESTGVPDVDYGVLMYYNMGHITAEDLSNSIYDRETAQKYLSSLKHYPLKLEVALPLFSWGIHSREGKVIGLLNQWTETTIDSTQFKNLGNRKYVATDNFITKGNFFRKGDLVKIEAVDPMEIREMVDDLANNIATKPQTIIFYDLDEQHLTHYNDEDLFEEVTRAF